MAGLAVTTTMLGHLRSTRPWVRFLSVMGFIGLGFMGFAALMFALMSLVPAMRSGSFPGAIMALVYLVLGAVYLWPVLSLHRFGRALTRLLAEGGGEALEGAFRQQFSFWKVTGILTIIMVGLVIAAVPIFVIVGVASRR